MDRARCRGQRRARARRHDRRRDRGQHRDRPGAGRQCARLSHDHRDARQPEPEKMDTLRALGAELVLVPPTKFSDRGHFVHTSRRLAEETPGAVWANQFDNIANRKAHIESTAPEIWEQMEGRIDGFTCAVGTGGTLAGVGMGLKERRRERHHRADRSARRGALQLLRHRRTEVPRAARSPKASARAGSPPTSKARRSTPSSASLTRKGSNGSRGCCRRKGCASACRPASTWPGAVALGRQLRQGIERVATILCDTGFRYLSTLYNAEWLAAQGPAGFRLAAPH